MSVFAKFISAMISFGIRSTSSLSQLNHSSLLMYKLGLHVLLSRPILLIGMCLIVITIIMEIIKTKSSLPQMHICLLLIPTRLIWLDTCADFER